MSRPHSLKLDLWVVLQSANVTIFTNNKERDDKDRKNKPFQCPINNAKQLANDSLNFTISSMGNF